MSRLIVFSASAAFVAFLFFAIPAQADEIEPEPAPAAEPAPKAEPEPEPEPVPEPTLARDDDFARNGIYAGISFGGTFYTEVEDDIDDALEAPLPESPRWLTNPGFSGHVDSEKPLGLGVRAGYRFHPRLAGEVQFQWFTNSEVDFTGHPVADPDIKIRKMKIVKIETLTLMGNVKGYALTGRIQPFVLAGGGLIHYDVEDKVGLGEGSKGDDFAARFGGGVDLYFNRNIVLVLESSYVLPTGGASDLDQVQVSVGLNYRF
jgi:opacity protein-like surface antigen